MVLSICILKAVACLDLFAVGLIVPLVAIHIRRLGANYIHVGLLGSMYAVAQLGSGPLIGSWSDLKGRKTILIMTLLVSGAGYALKGFTNSFYVIIFLRVVLGIFKQTQMLTRAMVPDYEKNEQRQGEIYGKMNAISGIGMTVGPLIGGHVAEDFPDIGFKFIAVTVGICFLINAVLVSLLPNPTTKKPRRRRSQSTGTESKTGALHSISSSLKQSFLELCHIEWSLYWDVFLFKGLIGFALGVYYSNYASYLREYYLLSPKYIGYIISFQSIIGSLSSYFMGIINSFYEHDKDYSQRNFHVFIMLTSALLGIIFSFNIYMYTFMLIPFAVGNAMGRLITLEMVLKRGAGKHRGTLIGASNSVRSLTGVVSPMVAGVIGQMFGVEYVVYASFLSAMVGLVLSYQCKSERLKSE